MNKQSYRQSMKTFRLLAALVGLLAATPRLQADDLEKIAGKWSVNRTNDQGQAYSQTLEVKKDKLTFKIIGGDGSLRLYATGDVKLEKCGPFSVIKITNIKAGQSEGEASPVDDDRTMIYQIGVTTWTIASNFDKERSQEPRVEVYTKVDK